MPAGGKPRLLAKHPQQPTLTDLQYLVQARTMTHLYHAVPRSQLCWEAVLAGGVLSQLTSRCPATGAGAPAKVPLQINRTVNARCSTAAMCLLGWAHRSVHPSDAHGHLALIRRVWSPRKHRRRISCAACSATPTPQPPSRPRLPAASKDVRTRPRGTAGARSSRSPCPATSPTPGSSRGWQGAARSPPPRAA